MKNRVQTHRIIPARAITAAIALLVFVFSLSGCTAKLKFKNSKIIDPKTGAEYVYTSGCYLPKSVSEEVYAVFDFKDVKVNYYEIEGLDPSEWLVSEVGDMIYAGSDRLPDLAEFAPVSFHIGFNSDILFSLAEVTDKEKVDLTVRRCIEGEKLDANYLDANTYRILFESEKYPCYYYMLYLIVIPDGYYIYDRTGGYMIEAGDIFSDLVDPYSYTED